MDYLKIYDALIRKGLTQQTDETCEKHHIVPKSLGGSDNERNIVKLTLRQHFVAHRLLTKFTKGVDNFKMVCAVYRLGFDGRKRDVTSRTYKIIREAHRAAVSEAGKGRRASDELRHKLSRAQIRRYAEKGNPRRGIPLPEEVRRAIGDAQRGALNHGFGKPRADEVRQQISRAMKGRKKSPSTVAKFRDRIQSDESKRQISESLREYHRKRKEMALQISSDSKGS